MSLGPAWEWLVCCLSPAFGVGGPSYFNRCYRRVDRPLALGLGFPCANRSGLIVYTWALINAKKMLKVTSGMLAISQRTLMKLLGISTKRILAAFLAVSTFMLHLNKFKNYRKSMYLYRSSQIEGLAHILETAVWFIWSISKRGKKKKSSWSSLTQIIIFFSLSLFASMPGSLQAQ